MKDGKQGSFVAWILSGTLIAMPGTLFAATPPSLIHYQGVLRGADDAPLTGAYDMEFRFFDAEIGGSEVLVDRHLAANAQAVLVEGGLFAVGLGSGAVLDGSGPGICASLADLFRDHGTVWLEVRIGAETLAPRTRVLATGYALNAATAGTASQLNGQPSGYYVDTSPTRQQKDGAIRFVSPDNGYGTIDAVHTGPTQNAAGYFEDNSFTGRAWLAEGNRGISALGSEYGGYFESAGYGARTWLARDATAVWANAASNGGACAGRFYGAFDGASHAAQLGCNGGTGVDGYGNPGGHFLSNWGWTGEAFLGYGDEGMHGYGTFVGGYFVDLDSSSWVRTAFSTYKVQGSGSVSFVQNHPYDKEKVIVYAAPEGDEVAVYTRGTARLVNGQARVRLGETFALVANPDVGLSANVTPIGDPVPLAVVEKSTGELLVRGPAHSNAEFDYIVWGLRIGFESQGIVQPKVVEARVPAMTDHEASYEKNPALRGFSALERFKAMRPDRDGEVVVDLTRANRLLEAVGTYDPGRDGPVETLQGVRRPADGPGHETSAQAQLAGPGTCAATDPAAIHAKPAPSGAKPPEPTTPIPSEPHPWLEPLPASGAIEAGDVVVLDPLVAGAVKRCDGAADRNLVGVAVAPDLEGTVEVAVATILAVRVDAGFGAIAPGDLLTTSATPGAAMRATVAEPGTILGKALEPFESGMGTIRVLLMPR